MNIIFPSLYQTDFLHVKLNLDLLIMVIFFFISGKLSEVCEGADLLHFSWFEHFVRRDDQLRNVSDKYIILSKPL